MQGALLAHAGMLVTEENYARLLRVKTYILEEIAEDMDLEAFLATILPEKKQEFLNFKKTYEEKEQEVAETLIQIGDGVKIDLAKTFSLTDNIMAQLEHKNDIFRYLGHMKDFDNHTFSHCSNVSLLCNLFGQWLGYSADQLLELTVSGILHDVGKTLIPLDILNKKGKLTPEEYDTIKNHTVHGYKLLEKQTVPNSIRMVVLQHHEKTDGSGYPFGVRDDKIHTYAKIASICDIYDAMTSTRSYREKICPFEVIRTFETGVYGALDTELLFIFLNKIAFVYLNSRVLLSDGREAEVIFITEKKPSRPMVKTADGKIINLMDQPDLTIEKILQQSK
jgi:putative nucleotidyltransferase with HDIG domain